jgi:hypothetical protein
MPFQRPHSFSKTVLKTVELLTNEEKNAESDNLFQIRQILGISGY